MTVERTKEVHALSSAASADAKASAEQARGTLLRFVKAEGVPREMREEAARYDERPTHQITALTLLLHQPRRWAATKVHRRKPAVR